MPKTVILKIVQSADDAKFLQELAKSSRLARKCVYVGTYGKRFILCYEKHNSKFTYYAVDMLTGQFSRIHESSFEFSQSAIVREIGAQLVNAVKHTGVFNRVRGPEVRKRVWGTESRL